MQHRTDGAVKAFSSSGTRSGGGMMIPPWILPNHPAPGIEFGDCRPCRVEPLEPRRTQQLHNSSVAVTERTFENGTGGPSDKRVENVTLPGLIHFLGTRGQRKRDATAPNRRAR